MYYYVYDTFVAEPRFERLLTRLETQANNLGLTGERGQVTSLRKVEDLVREAAQRGYAPIVIVGDDRTLNAAVNSMAKLGSSTPLAYVPVLPAQPIAELLGVTAEDSIVTLSRRIVRHMRLAYANEHCFIAQLTCTPTQDASPRKVWLQHVRRQPPLFEPTVAIDGRMKISAPVHELIITHDPVEGRLRVTLSRARSGFLKSGFIGHAAAPERSSFWGTNLEVRAATPIACHLDGRQVVRTPVVVASSDRTVRFVVGRQRLVA